MYYKNIHELPHQYAPIIMRLVNRGIIQMDEDFEFPLSDDLLHIIVLLARLGFI